MIPRHAREKRQTVIEFMIAHARRVVAHLVHHLVHREQLVACERLHLSLKIRQRRALNRVAVIKQQRVGVTRARLSNQRGNALEAN